MRIVAVETSGERGGVCLRSQGKTLREIDFQATASHARELVPSLSEILSSSKVSAHTLDAIACDIGPGSYTGLRIGVIAAKTIAWTLSKPIVPVISLDAVARGSGLEEGLLAVMIDAKQGLLYARTYEVTGGIPGAREECLVATPQEVQERLEPGVSLTGDALRRYASIFSKCRWKILPEEFWFPRASVVALLGEELFRKGLSTDPFTLQPLYLRRPTAELLWEKRQRAP